MSRFVKVTLAQDFDEPLEMVITDESKVIIIERTGSLKMYSPTDGKIRKIGYVPVYYGQEDGLLGIALDPQYRKNNHVYLFYSPPGDTPLQRVSRFELKNDSLLLNTERQIIDIPTQRKECCHSAGALAFGPDNNLYIAVGDNTNPHNPGYYNSVDERKGREYWDAQRTAGNANDLRGKILRITPKPEGGYTIPKGNLFPEGQEGTRPEIYVMGCRNPFRITLDSKRGWLFWGDVGQNTADDPKRGPISYDEWNVATEAGFFGWPYFAGPNAPYAEYDYNTGKIGAFFDPQKPVNKSVNNTGIKELPPAKGAMIWYSYDESKEFQHLGTGGKSPIPGPVYYSDEYAAKIKDSSRHLPNWYDGKFFIMEWIRNWINVVSVDSSGKVDSIEQFMPGTAFNHPINMKIGPDGVLYLLEYGSNWLVRNKDAGLYRIDYVRGEKPIQPKPDTSTIAKSDTVQSQLPGYDLIQEEDCKSCHALKDKSIGPSFVAIADRYKNNEANIKSLADKIIQGGSGVWGDYAMSAHPHLSVQRASEMVKYILSNTTASLQGKWVNLFDGKTLQGWHTIPGGEWKAENGMITGVSDHTDERHGLLVTDKQFGDFELELKFKSVKGNSGLYFRVDETGGTEGVNGLQAEIHPEEYIGGLYETGGRAWVSQPNQDDVKKWYKPGQWNTMNVKATGGNIVIRVNGIKTAELTNDPGRKKGHIALQLHGGQDMLVYFRDIKIRE